MLDDTPTVEAYWVRQDGTEEAYIVQLTPRHKGQRGWAEYQADLHRVQEISRSLADEGVQQKYRSPTA